jgi:hypothetical protein
VNVKNELEQYVSENFNSWKEKYQFNDCFDFQVKTLFKLQYEFDQLESSHSKSQAEKLKMIDQIMSMLMRDNNFYKVINNKN